ncbi:MAG: NAD(P)H-dependent oxidoreductase [Actinomycetota bacterium]
MSTANLTDLLNWRYATKKMDPTKVVPSPKVEAIIEAVRLTPTSSGLQPFELIVVTNQQLRAQIAEAAGGQAQVVEGSHLLVFAAWDNYTEERIDEVVELNVEIRGDLPMRRAYYDNLKNAYLRRDAQMNHAHAARQAYIAVGVALVAAAEQQVDSTPMEGFNPDAVDVILGLRERGLRSVVLMPLGYRDSDNDWLLPMAKVRKPLTSMVTHLP